MFRIGNETRATPEEVGKALKTIINRLKEVDAKPVTEQKELYEILEELGVKWDSLGRTIRSTVPDDLIQSVTIT